MTSSRIISEPRLVSFSWFKTHRHMISSRRRYSYALESYPLIPLANSGRSRKKCYTFFFRIDRQDEDVKEREGGEEGSRIPLRRDASSFSTTLAKRPTLHVAYLRKTDGHIHDSWEGPPSRAAPWRERDACLSRAKEPERRQCRESLGESLGRRCGGGRAEFLRDRGRATRRRHVSIFM